MSEVGPLLQNIVVTAGNKESVSWSLNPDTGLNLVGSRVYFSVFAQAFGLPQGDAIIRKQDTAGITVTAASGPPTFTIDFDGVETADLRGNYFFEICIKDTGGSILSVTQGPFFVGNMPTTDFTSGEVP